MNYGMIVIVAIVVTTFLQWLAKWARYCMQNVPLSECMPTEFHEYNDRNVEEDQMNTGGKTDEKGVNHKQDWRTEQKWQVEYKLMMQQEQKAMQLEMEKLCKMKRGDVEMKRYIEIEPNMENTSRNKIEKKVCETEKSPLAHQENNELREQLNDLQQHCRELLQELRAANSSSSSSSQGSVSALGSNSSSSSFSSYESDDPTCVLMWKPPAAVSSSGLSGSQNTESVILPTQKVYVTHSHYHFNFNGPVHLTKQNINIGTLNPKKALKRSEFLQVWGTFISGPEERPMLTGINNILM